MARRRRKGHALRRRYGRAFSPVQVITRPAGGGRVDVIEVDSRGAVLRTLGRSVPYGLAKAIILRRRG